MSEVEELKVHLEALETVRSRELNQLAQGKQYGKL